MVSKRAATGPPCGVGFVPYRSGLVLAGRGDPGFRDRPYGSLGIAVTQGRADRIFQIAVST